MEIFSHTFEAGAYRFTLRHTARGICGLLWGVGGPQAPRGRPPAFVTTAERRIRAYFTHGAEIRGVRLDLTALTPFQRRVVSLLPRIPPGETVTYGRLAAMAGAPGAARAVGAAMARNPLPIILPCHRVIASDRTLRGFSGYGGLKTKRALLSSEGVQWERDGTLSPACVRAQAQNGRQVQRTVRAKSLRRKGLVSTCKSNADIIDARARGARRSHDGQG